MPKHFSRKRQAVLQVLQQTKEHPTAETIFARCREIEPSISLGTVYRNLQQLEADGEIIRVATVDGKERYDADVSAHQHVICPVCHCVRDYCVCDRLRKSLGEECDKQGFDAFRLTFYRTCNECAQSKLG